VALTLVTQIELLFGKDFFTLWKDANPDPDIPILKEAKTEYARLQ
jgi:hypothetical protein